MNTARLLLAAFLLVPAAVAQTTVTTPWFTSSDGAISDGTWLFENDGDLLQGALTVDTAAGVSGGTITFTGLAELQATTSGAISGGTQAFGDISLLNATASDAVSGGTQNFSGNASLFASEADAVSGGTQTFTDNANLNLFATGALSGGAQTFSGSSLLNASGVMAVVGGTQVFNQTSGLQAGDTNAVAGGAQDFFDSASLSAVTGQAVSGGTQTFHEDSRLTVSALLGVTGGTQVFSDNATARAQASGAIQGANLTFTGNSRLLVGADYALGAADGSSSATRLTFDGTGGAAPALVLQGHDVTVGKIESSGTGARIRNTSAGAATLTIASGLYDSLFTGVIEDGIGGGSLALVKSGAAKLTLGGANTFSGGATLSGGTLLLTHAAALGSGPLVIAGGTLGIEVPAVDPGNPAPVAIGNALVLGGAFTIAAAAAGTDLPRFDGAVTLSSDVTVTNFADITFASPIAGAHNFTVLGTGRLTVTASNTYSGTTSVRGGTLVVNGSLASSLTTVEDSGTLAGTGIVGPVTVKNGGTLSPGSSTGPATLGTGNLALDDGGIFAFDIDDASGTAGVNWDTLTVNGVLSFTSTSSAPFVFKITTFSGSAPGPMAGYVAGQPYEWLLATASGGISGLGLDNVSFDVSGFGNVGVPAFNLRVVGNDLYLTTVPEPAEWGVVLGLGLLALAAARQKACRAA